MNFLFKISNNKKKMIGGFFMETKDYDYLKSASVQDCTGLIPAQVEYEEELENYEDLYPFLPQAVSTNTDPQKDQ